MSIVMNEALEWIFPVWPAPGNVQARTTTRTGGVSSGPYQSFNLADHVGDSAGAVSKNRARLVAELGLEAEPVWLSQVHGVRVIRADDVTDRFADGSFTQSPGVVCAVLTADCLPLLLCDRTGSRVAAVHAGWRGLASGVVEAAVDAMACDGSQLIAWLGPAIGPDAFEVGGEVREAFLDHDDDARLAFTPGREGRWYADMHVLARQRLQRRGVGAVYGGHWCTWTERQRFFSYRRDGRTGRMATLIWLERAG